MTFDQFVERIATLLKLDLPEQVGPDASLYDDVGIDSFEAFQLLIVIEGLAECLVPPLEFPELYTLGDAYAYYQVLRTKHPPWS